MKKLRESKVRLVVLTALVSGLVGWGVGWLQGRTELGSDLDNSAISETNPLDSPLAQENSSLAKERSPLPTPAKKKEVVAAPTASLKPYSVASAQGGLRVSNQTDLPIRVALLRRPKSVKSSGKPAHWDFAPGEGGIRGLTLSLPEGSLLLEKGDVLVAFAEDGSRRYWGPYVVGETPMPVWSSQGREWNLVLNFYP